MKIKSEGISVFLAMGVSLFVLAVAMSVLSSVQRSFDRTRDIELSTQFFFASESGVEAAMFHKNSRGRGVEFNDPVNDNLDKTDVINRANPEFVLSHDTLNLNTVWGISGRTTPSLDLYTGILRENEKLDIPFFWDGSTLISDDPLATGNQINISEINGLDFKVDWPDYHGSSYRFGRLIPKNAEDDPAKEVVLTWAISRYSDTNGLQTLKPLPGDESPCDITGTDVSTYYCENRFFGQDNQSLFTAATEGLISPCPSGNLAVACRRKVGTFLTEDVSVYKDYVLSVASVLPFENENGEKIEGIPFTVTHSSFASNEMPTPYYTITSEVQSARGDFDHRLEITTKEKTSNKSFDYVIFD